MRIIGKVAAAVAVSALALQGMSTAMAQSSEFFSGLSSHSAGLVERNDAERLERAIERSYIRQGGVLFGPFEDSAAGYAEQALTGYFEFQPLTDGSDAEGYTAFSVSPGHITVIYRNSEESIPELIHRYNTDGIGAPFPGPTDHMGVEVRAGDGYVYVVILSGLGEPPPVIEA